MSQLFIDAVAGFTSGAKAAGAKIGEGQRRMFEDRWRKRKLEDEEKERKKRSLLLDQQTEEIKQRNYMVSDAYKANKANVASARGVEANKLEIAKLATSAPAYESFTNVDKIKNEYEQIISTRAGTPWGKFEGKGSKEKNAKLKNLNDLHKRQIATLNESNSLENPEPAKIISLYREAADKTLKAISELVKSSSSQGGGYLTRYDYLKRIDDEITKAREDVNSLFKKDTEIEPEPTPPALGDSELTPANVSLNDLGVEVTTSSSLGSTLKDDSSPELPTFNIDDIPATEYKFKSLKDNLQESAYDTPELFGIKDSNIKPLQTVVDKLENNLGKDGVEELIEALRSFKPEIARRAVKTLKKFALTRNDFNKDDIFDILEGYVAQEGGSSNRLNVDIVNPNASKHRRILTTNETNK